MRMPDDRDTKPNSRRRHDQTSADAVGMNKIRRFPNDCRTRLANYPREGSEIPNKTIRTPGKTRRQRVHAGGFNAQVIYHLDQLRLRWAQHDRIEAAAIEPGQSHQQHSFSAADLSGVVVEKNLHYIVDQQTSVRRRDRLAATNGKLSFVRQPAPSRLC